MKFKQSGNLGKTDLLLGHILLKQIKSEDGFVTFSEDEVQEIVTHLDKFVYLMSNLNLYKNALANDQYRGLIRVIEDTKEYYKDYKDEEKAMEAITVKCIECKKDNIVNVNKEDLNKWKSGTHIQNAMPYLTPSQRELLISKVCGPCFDTLFE